MAANIKNLVNLNVLYLKGQPFGAIRQNWLLTVLLSTSDICEEEKEKVRRLVKDFGMEKFARAMMWVMGYVFQLEQSKMLWRPDERRGRFLLSEVMQMGNFGHTDGRFGLRREDSHVRRFWQRVKSKMRFWGFFPSEALRYPFSLLCLVIELRWLRWKVRRYEKECWVHG